MIFPPYRYQNIYKFRHKNLWTHASSILNNTSSSNQFIYQYFLVSGRVGVEYRVERMPFDGPAGVLMPVSDAGHAELQSDVDEPAIFFVNVRDPLKR